MKPVREPVVLDSEAMASELARLGGELRTQRESLGLSTREAGTRAGMAQSGVWRTETARHPPSFLSFARLAEAVGATVEVDDGRPVRRLAPGEPWPLPGGYKMGPAVVHADWPVDKQQLHGRLHSVRVRLGAELWWARHAELDEPLDAEAACRVLGMSHHTVSNVEFGPKWPDLASVILVAGLTGRRLVLAPLNVGLRLPPWAPDGLGGGAAREGRDGDGSAGIGGAGA